MRKNLDELTGPALQKALDELGYADADGPCPKGCCRCDCKCPRKKYLQPVQDVLRRFGYVTHSLRTPPHHPSLVIVVDGSGMLQKLMTAWGAATCGEYVAYTDLRFVAGNTGPVASLGPKRFSLTLSVGFFVDCPSASNDDLEFGDFVEPSDTEVAAFAMHLKAAFEYHHTGN